MMTILRHRHLGSDQGFIWGRNWERESERMRERGKKGKRYQSLTFPLPCPPVLSLSKSIAHGLYGGVRPGFEWGVIIRQNHGAVTWQVELRFKYRFDIAGPPDLF